MATKTIVGFGLWCPNCGEEEPAITLDLNDLQGTCFCHNCETEYTVKDAANKVQDNARRWAAVARWIEAAGTFVDPKDA